MKKSDFLEIHFRSFNQFSNDLKSALAGHKKYIQPKNHIVFDSVVTFRNFMTIQKIELLTTIAIQKPASIYELAKLVDRDFAGVLRDCTGLENVGFITLKPTHDAKGSKVPKLKFSYHGLIIFIPKNPYQIDFSIAA
jgi:predicted transcriptional regulator